MLFLFFVRALLKLPCKQTIRTTFGISVRILVRSRTNIRALIPYDFPRSQYTTRRGCLLLNLIGHDNSCYSWTKMKRILFSSSAWWTPPCEDKMQYLLTCRVTRYCLCRAEQCSFCKCRIHHWPINSGGVDSAPRVPSSLPGRPISRPLLGITQPEETGIISVENGAKAERMRAKLRAHFSRLSHRSAQHCFKDQDDGPTPGPRLHSTFPAWALGSLRIFYTSSCLGTERKRPGVRRLELKRRTTVQAHHCRAEDKQK